MPRSADQLTQAEMDLILDLIMADKDEDQIIKDLDEQLDPEIREAASEFISKLFSKPQLN